MFWTGRWLYCSSFWKELSGHFCTFNRPDFLVWCYWNEAEGQRDACLSQRRMTKLALWPQRRSNRHTESQKGRRTRLHVLFLAWVQITHLGYLVIFSHLTASKNNVFLMRAARAGSFISLSRMLSVRAWFYPPPAPAVWSTIRIHLHSRR